MAILKYKDQNGNFVVLPTGGGSSGSSGSSSAEDVTYDNTESGLSAEDVQSAVDELSENVIDYSLDETGTGLTIDGGFLPSKNIIDILWENTNIIDVGEHTITLSSSIFNYDIIIFEYLGHNTTSNQNKTYGRQTIIILPLIDKTFQFVYLGGGDQNSAYYRTGTILSDTSIQFSNGIQPGIQWSTSLCIPINVKGIKFNNIPIKKQQHIYSEEEQVVGTWIDGKPIYEKTLLLDSIPKGETKFSHLIENFDKAINAYGFFTRTSDGIQVPLTLTHPTSVVDYACTIIYVNETVISIYRGSEWDSGNVLVTIQYTKTTD